MCKYGKTVYSHFVSFQKKYVIDSVILFYVADQITMQANLFSKFAYNQIMFLTLYMCLTTKSDTPTPLSRKQMTAYSQSRISTPRNHKIALRLLEIQ